MDQQKPKTQIKMRTTRNYRVDQLQDVPDWLQEFRHGLVDKSVPEHRDASSSSHQLPSEPRAKVVSGKHSIFIHFYEDRNWDICLRTKIRRASCTKRTGTVVPRAEIFGDLITADHKVLSDNCESRNNHRYAVVVQDLTTQWTQPYPCKTKTSQETERRLQKFLEPTRKPKVIHTDNSQILANLVKIFPGIVLRQHPTDRKLMGLMREQYAEWKKVRLQYCCNQIWMKNGGQIPWNALLICETC